MTVLDIVTSNLQGSGVTTIAITQAVDETAYVIKNYCNISDIPDGLKYTWANMAEDLARYRAARDKADSGTLPAASADNVSELRIGDTTIKLGGNARESSSKELKAHTVDADSLIMNYQSQLNKFRRMVW